MSDVGTILTSMFGAGGIAAVVQAGQFIRDGRRSKRESADQKAIAPLREQALELGVLTTATDIQRVQQGMIDGLVQRVEEAELRHSIYKADSDQKIAGLLAENKAQATKIAEMHATIGEMEVEMRRLRRTADP